MVRATAYYEECGGSSMDVRGESACHFDESYEDKRGDRGELEAG